MTIVNEQRRICKQGEKQKQNFVVRQNLLNQSASVVLITRWETSAIRSQPSRCGLHFAGPTPHRIVGQVRPLPTKATNTFENMALNQFFHSPFGVLDCKYLWWQVNPHDVVCRSNTPTNCGSSPHCRRYWVVWPHRRFGGSFWTTSRDWDLMESLLSCQT